MSDSVITIVGGGASSVSLIDALLDGKGKVPAYGKMTIFMVEKQSQFGRGLAYAEDNATNLLNTRAGFISPFANKPGHFYQWLKDNRIHWEDDFPGVKLDPDVFLPRPLFGRYLSHMVQWLSNRAIELGCRLTAVNDEVVRISFAHDGRVVVSTRGDLSFPSDHVVLSCGNGGTLEYQHMNGAQGFYSTPYPIKRTSRLIPKSAHVGIIGSRLSAIDTVLGLVAKGHSGPITLHSRSGALPSVRGTQGRYTPKFLTLDHVKEHIARTGAVRLDEFIDWILKEMSIAGEKVPEAIGGLLEKCTQRRPLEYLLSEIDAAREPRLWQAVLYATNGVIDAVWAAMPGEDKQRFWPYLSRWMCYRVSIPVENAIKIASLLQTGQLNIVLGSVRVSKQADGLIIEVTNGSEVRCHAYDAVIVATGTPRDVKMLDNPLIQNMLAERIAQADRFGGVQVSPITGALVGASGNADERITVLGELTSGAFFFTSALEINARHAANRAGIILQRLASVRASTVLWTEARLQA